MASITGDILSSGLEHLNPNDVDGIICGVFDYDPDITANTEFLSGDLDFNLITNQRQLSDGDRFISFLDDFYYRIHIEPNPLAFGFLSGATEETFELWNAFFTGKVCTAITEINGGQYSLSGLTTPFVLGALEATTYTVTALADGSPEFISTIDFDFGAEYDYTILTVTGTRIVLFKWSPLTPMKESLEWLTDIITAKDGTEQRISARRVPRQGYIITIYLDTHQQQAEFDALVHKWQKKAWGLPVWVDWELHSGTISAGATSITHDTTYADYRADGLGVVWQDEDNYEILKIESITDTTITLSTPMQNTFIGDKYIMPLRVAQMNTPVKRKDAPDGYCNNEISFVVKGNKLLTGYTPATTYKGLPVLTKATYADGGQEKASDADIIFSDYMTGNFNLYSDSEFNRVIQTHTFKYFDKASAWDYRLFLHYLLGQLNTVWVPSNKNDMVLTATINPADVSFSIVNVGYTMNMGLNELRTNLAFIFSDGSMLFREITGISEIDSGSELIQIDSALGVEVGIGECMVCFLDKYRLASDKVNINWDHRGWCVSKVDWLRVKA